MAEEVTITVDQVTQEVNIDVTSGGGLGTVTYVAISGTDGIEVDSGSPIITSGTIVLGLSSTVLSQLSLAASSIQPGDNITDLTNNAGFISNITGLVTPGTNVTITGSGTSGSPYVINATASIGTVDATDVMTDESGWSVLSGSNAQLAFNSADEAVLNARSTGVRYGGIASVDGGLGVGSTVSITEGQGEILDITDPEVPVYTSVTWVDFNTQAPSVSPGTTYWYIDSAGSLQQTATAPTGDTYRTRIWICQTTVTAGVISALANISVPLQQAVSALHDLSSAIGTIRVTGASPTFSGSNLKLKVTSGSFYDFGVTRWSTPLAPNTPIAPEFDSGVGGIFRYLTTSGVIATDYTDIQVGSYQVGGVVTAIPGASTRVGVHYVIGFPSGNTRLSYGLNWYNNFTEALASLAMVDPYSTVPSTVNRSNSFILGAVLAQKGATDLSNASQATFVTTNRFGQFGGAAALAGAGYLEIDQNLADLADASVARTNLGLVIGTNVQAYDAGLQSISGLTTAANNGIYTTGSDAYATYSLTAGGRALGGVAGTANTIPYFSASNTVSLLTTTTGGRALLNNAGTANTFPYYSASNTVSLASITTFGRSLIDDADAATARTTLGAIGGSTGSTDNALLRADGTGGASSQGSLATLDDFGNLNAGSLNTTGGTVGFGAFGSDTIFTPTDRWYRFFRPSSTAGNKIEIINNWSSEGNYEAGVIDFRTTANVCLIGSDVGSGGGTARDVRLIRGGVSQMEFEGSGVINLPATTSTAEAVVSDATIPVKIGGVTYKILLKA